MSALYVRVWHSANRTRNQLGSRAPVFCARVARVQEFCALKILRRRSLVMAKIQTWQSFGDVNMLDYGGGFCREVSPRVFQFVELTNMDEACGRDNEGRSRYDVQLSLVDLNAIPPAELESARKSCGWDGMPDSAAAQAEMAYQYGLRAPLGSWDGNNAGKLLREAKSEARALLDAGRLAEQLEKPVNKLGSTAAEFMRGDINAALTRVILPCASWEEAEIVAQNARNRSEMRRVRIVARKPRLQRGHLYSLFDREFASRWYEKGGFQREDRKAP